MTLNHNKVVKFYFYIFIILCLFIPINSSSDTAIATIKNISSIDVCFSPGGGCTAGIVKEINTAKHQILIQAYSFTSSPIAAALVAAHKRGITVEVILDKSQKKDSYTAATFLNNAHIQTYIDYNHAIAHNI